MLLALFVVWLIGFLVALFGLIFVDSDLTDAEVLVASTLWFFVCLVLAAVTAWRGGCKLTARLIIYIDAS